MNQEEIEWIVRNLFVGNRLWDVATEAAPGQFFDLRSIKAPIILFASMGDNITPPQQAFNWVADIYGSTEEIKARGQTIIGLVHENIGHLGIFVSGKVAKKEHSQIVSVLKCIEHLPAGLWAMKIHEKKRPEGGVEYEVDFTERTLEEVAAQLNRFERRDEKPFEAAAEVSEFNQRIYDAFVRPFVRAFANDELAEWGRQFHPLRFSRWAMSNLNPAMGWLESAAESVKAARRAVAPDHPMRRGERFVSELVSASFDLYRDLRDAASEAAFYHCYGNMYLFNPSGAALSDGKPSLERNEDPRQLSHVREALLNIDRGGYVEAVARAAYLLTRRGEPLPVWRLNLRQELAKDYRDLLPDVPSDQWRKVRGVQEIIVRYEPEKAMQAFPILLAKPEDRRRFLSLLDRLLSDERVQVEDATPEQKDALRRIQEVLGVASMTQSRSMEKAAAAPVKKGIHV